MRSSLHSTPAVLQAPPLFTSLHFTSHLTAPHLHFTSTPLHFTSPSAHLTSLHFSSHLTSLHTSPHTSPQLNSTSPHLTSLHFTHFTSLHLTSLHFTHFTSLHFTNQTITRFHLNYKVWNLCDVNLSLNSKFEIRCNNVWMRIR
jgi:hypothetical protein